MVFYCEIHLKYCQDTINRQFNSTMENNFAGKTACSLSYRGAGVRQKNLFSPKLMDYFIQGVRNIESNIGESTRQGNLRHPSVRLQSFSLRGLPSQRTIVILPKGVGDFPILYFFRCLILFLTKHLIVLFTFHRAFSRNLFFHC